MLLRWKRDSNRLAGTSPVSLTFAHVTTAESFGGPKGGVEDGDAAGGEHPDGQFKTLC